MQTLTIALAYASDRARLRRRLFEARTDLADRYRKQFGRGRFDFAGRRLIGDNGLTLQWAPHGRSGVACTFGCVSLEFAGAEVDNASRPSELLERLAS
jgi:hypothetical protein